MMTPLMLSTLTILIAAPSITICDDDSNKAAGSLKTDFVSTAHPHLNLQNDEESDYENLHDPWSFYRKLRAPSGFLGMRGKKDFDPTNYWDVEVSSTCNNFKPL